METIWNAMALHILSRKPGRLSAFHGVSLSGFISIWSWAYCRVPILPKENKKLEKISGPNYWTVLTAQTCILHNLWQLWSTHISMWIRAWKGNWTCWGFHYWIFFPLASTSVLRWNYEKKEYEREKILSNLTSAESVPLQVINYVRVLICLLKCIHLSQFE